MKNIYLIDYIKNGFQIKGSYHNRKEDVPMESIDVLKIYDRLHLDNESPIHSPITVVMKGFSTYAHSFADGLMNRTEEHPLQREIWGDLMTGKEFFTYIDNGSITDYDGRLSAVFVDGYKSNLGLTHRDFCQGGFLIDGESWLDMCESHKILVEWCNK